MSNVGGSGQGPSGIHTGTGNTGGIPPFTREERPISDSKLEPKKQGGSPEERVEPPPTGEAAVMRVTITIPKDKFKEFISQLPDYAQVIESKVSDGGTRKPISFGS